jgi:hypothetical protein
LSGYYANCEALKKPHGIITVDRISQDGSSIGGIVDSIEGRETHVDAAANYINQLIRRWNAAQLYNGLVSSLYDFTNYLKVVVLDLKLI